MTQRQRKKKPTDKERESEKPTDIERKKTLLKKKGKKAN